MISREEAKKLWTFLLKKRDIQPEVIFFQDEGDRRAMSLAYAVCELYGLKKDKTLFRISNPEWKADPLQKIGDNKMVNSFVYEQVKAARGMVV